MIYEIKTSVKLNQDLKLAKSYAFLGKAVATAIYDNASNSLKNLHYKHEYKPYTFDNLGYVSNKIYKAGKKYSLLIKTISEDIANEISSFKNDFLELKINSINFIREQDISHVKFLFSNNPAVLVKKDKTYWTQKDGIETAIKLINANAVKKYMFFFNEDIDPNFDFIDIIQPINNYPINIHYDAKGIKTLGNKFILVPKEDELSQSIARMLYAVGIGNKNASLGAGSVSIGGRKNV